MKVVFMGTPEFAAICLEEIINSKHEVVGVVSVPDKPSGRGQKITQSAVTKLATEKKLKLLQPEKLKNSEFIQELINLQADVFVVVAFRMLPKEVWQIPSKGTFNLHASLLPQYRGAAPINWAIINGETQSGVTTFLIDEKIDTGNILLQRSVEISPKDNTGDLHDELAEVGKQLIIETLNGMENDSIQPKPQTGVSNLKSAPKLFKDDCKIDWTQPLEIIHNKIRGLSPYPAAWTLIEKGGEIKSLKLFKGYFESISNDKNIVNCLSFENNQIKIHLPEGDFYIEELQLEGKRRVNYKEFINGIHDKNGWKLSI